MSERPEDPRERGLREVLGRLGDSGEVCRLEGDGTFLAKSPRAVYEVLVGKEGLYENPPHPYRSLSATYRTTGSALLALTPRRDAVAELRAAAAAFLSRSPPIADGVVEVVPWLKTWSARFIANLLWRDFETETDRCEVLERFVREVSDMENRPRFRIEALSTHGRFVEDLRLPSSFPVADPRFQHALIRTFLNGYNAVAVALSWSLLRLARDASMQDALRAGEIESADFIHEILRLYPPAWVLRRRLLQDDELAGSALRAGAIVLVSPLVTQRDPLYWADPERLTPDRDRRSPRGELRCFPFGGGERICPSARFVPGLLAEILQTLLKRRRLEPVGDDGSSSAWTGRISLLPSPGARVEWKPIR